MYETDSAIPAAQPRKRWSRGIVAAVTVGATSSFALATPPAMPAISMPIDVASVIAGAVVVGGTILLAWAGPKIGFGLAKALVGKAAQIVKT